MPEIVDDLLGFTLKAALGFAGILLLVLPSIQAAFLSSLRHFLPFLF
jgi:hypothetical protein